MTREDVLAVAKKCVCGDREQDYGSPENNFLTIATFWSNYLNAVFPNAGIVVLSPEDVANMMILLKISRIVSGTGKDDNWIDIAGYAACGGELTSAKSES